MLDSAEVERYSRLGLAERGVGTLALTPRGRFVGGGLTARLLA
jgi:hypothetical protein